MQINRSISQSIIWLKFAYSQLVVSQQLHGNFFNDLIPFFNFQSFLVCASEETTRLLKLYVTNVFCCGNCNMSMHIDWLAIHILDKTIWLEHVCTQPKLSSSLVSIQLSYNIIMIMSYMIKSPGGSVTIIIMCIQLLSKMFYCDT